MDGFFHDGQCYKLITNASTWNSTQCQAEASKLGFSYGRLAVFSGSYIYNTVLAALTIGAGDSSPVWVGAQAATGGTLISNYCWMNDLVTVASQVSSLIKSVTSLTSAPVIGPYCLVYDPDDPTRFYYDACATAKHSYICEFGKRSGFVSHKVGNTHF